MPFSRRKIHCTRNKYKVKFAFPKEISKMLVVTNRYGVVLSER